MYEVQFTATSSADWAQAIELIDGDTNLPITGIEDATFKLAVDGPGGTPYLTASSAEGTITRPSTHIVQWVFDTDDLGSLCAGSTYSVGLTMTTDGGTIQILRGTLAFLDGVVTP